MKTILVPVDFTATSDNAVNFAAQWSMRYGYDRIILLKTFYDSMFDNIAVSAEYSHVNQDYMKREREEAMEQFEVLSRRLASQTDAGVKVLTAVSELPLLRAIMEMIEEENVDLLLLGSDNYNYSSGSFVAGNVINITKASPVRVLIVPADYTYKPVKQALLPYNLNMFNDLGRLHNLKRNPQWNDLKLLVLNVDASERNSKTGEKFKMAESKFQDLLKNFEYEIYYANDKNIINSIISFTKENNVQLVIALPGRHSFLYSLTHQSLSEAIYRNAREPVLILK